MLTDREERWRNDGAIEEVLGRQLFVRRRGGGDETLLLFLHGFPSSSYDWRELFELRNGEATLAFDFLGFGLSEKPRDHLYTLAWQADAAEELVRRAGSPPVFVVGHDMGTSVATEMMARDLRGQLEMNLTGALLFNGSMLLHLARPAHPRLGPTRPGSRTKVLGGLRALRPGVETFELPDAAHYPQIERPDLISSALDAALVSVR